ncbi:MAG: hypothetical protein AAF546_01890, partial [Verrucomicrobiota bacterium]
LLILSMVTLMQVENTTSDVGKKQMQAQQNAILSLQIALGELQKNMGPDQRVSARADILDSSSSERGNRIGVWSAQPDGSTLHGETYNRGDVVAWLASDARDASGYDTDYNESGLESDDTLAQLLGVGSLPSNNGTLVEPDAAVVLDMTNTTIEGNGFDVGRYAWWIDDEGLKARVNLEREEPASGETGYRAVLETMAFNKADASELPALTSGSATLGSIGLNNVSGRLVEFRDIKSQLPESQAEDFNPYFSDLTTWSSGIQADVKNGGLKKDLSLAFEMSDADFFESRFAQAGAHSYNVEGYGFVHPVFAVTREGDLIDGTAEIPNSGTVYAHGPLWSLLRQYYRIYQQIQNPLTDPVFTTQVMAPNVNHSLYSVSGSDLEDQPAIQFTGGLVGSAASNDNASNNAEPDTALLRMRVDRESPMLQDQSGDPYRANIDGQNVLTPMAESSYSPYLIRMLNEFGISFAQGPTASGFDLYNVQNRARSTFLTSNPYNVAISHPEIKIHFQGPAFSVSAYDQLTGDVVTALDGSGSPHNFFTDNWLNVPTKREIGSRVRIGEGTMSPGEIKAYRGTADGDGNTSVSSEIENVSDWTGFDKNKTGGQETMGPLIGIPAGSAIFTGYTIVGRIQNFTNVKTQFVTNQQSNNKDPRIRYYSLLEFSVNTFFDEGDGRFDADLDATTWPIAHSLTTVMAGVNSGYDTVLNNSSFSQTKLETAFPMSDSSFVSGPNGSITEVTDYSFGENASPTTYTNPNSPLPLVAVDFQLKPAEFDPFGGGTQELKFPPFVLTNPLAPVKDNKNLFPADDIVDEGVGFGAISPGWAVTLSQAPSGSGPDLRSWGPTDGSLLNGSSSLGDINPVMLELPTAPILSLGKLQFANITIYDHMPALAISNSFASPYVPLDKKFEIYQNRYGNERIFMDMSYLMNEALWDGYFFSSLSLPYSPDRYSGKVGETFSNAFESTSPTPLPNPRVDIEFAEGETVSDVQSKLFVGEDPAPDGYMRAAENLMVKGAFNINSTSIEAWSAVLAGARDQAILKFGGTLTNPIGPGTTPYSRFSQPFADESDGSDFTSPSAWGGFRTLTDSQIQTLASNIVQGIRDRTESSGHPCISLADFVNRQLSTSSVFARRGLLQVAIDQTLEINESLDGNSILLTETELDTQFVNYGTNAENLLDAEDEGFSVASMVPNYLLQADILQAIGSQLSARSDTFRIRSYGESIDPISGAIEGRAWCEAVVQRVPEPVNPRDGTDRDDDHEYWSALEINGDSTPFGRQFKIVSFRWLDDEEV